MMQPEVVLVIVCRSPAQPGNVKVCLIDHKLPRYTLSKKTHEIAEEILWECTHIKAGAWVKPKLLGLIEEDGLVIVYGCIIPEETKLVKGYWSNIREVKGLSAEDIQVILFSANKF